MFPCVCYLVFPLSLLVNVNAKGAFGHVLQHRELNSSKLHTGSSPRSQSGEFNRWPVNEKTETHGSACARAMERTKTIPALLHLAGHWRCVVLR